MSASLVGSEMCIRDSIFLGGGLAGRLVLFHALRRPAARALRGATPRFPCLLYTSDAADDM
eukprot:13433246-Alexandrium_andersonii.AAC.1